MNKVIILGAKGMLGQDLMKVFNRSNSIYEAIPATREQLNLEDIESIRGFLLKHKPNFVINAAAYTNVEECEDKRELAFSVNTEAVKHLAECCADLGTTLVHYSTDYVFNGKREKGYDEKEQILEPLNVYGASKAMAEENIANIYAWLGKEKPLKYYVIRTSWLFGENGKNFVQTMLNLAKDKDELSIVNDQFGKPTYTLDLAERTLEMMSWDMDYGIYHVTNEETCSWYDFARTIFALKNIPIKVKAVSSENFPTKATRPRHSSLLNTKLPPMRSWAAALEDYLDKV